MNRSVFVVALVIFFCFAQNVFGSLLSFQEEADRATKALNCSKAKITPANSGFGALYGCIAGSNETVKFFINEADDVGKVKNIKLMWNDWFVDIGYGKHADKSDAETYVKAFARLYAPKMEKKLTSIFFSNFSKVMEVGDYQIAYTYSRGPKIDERLLVLTPKAAEEAQEKSRNS